jgi:serine O-acetyltransferase
MLVRRAWRDFRADIERYSHVLGRSKWTVLFFAQGAQAALVYRVGHWWYTRLNAKIPLVRGLYLLHFFFFRLAEILTGISLEPKAEIGPGLYIGHFGGIIVGSGVTLGANCNLSQGVTLGVDGRGERRGSPQVGDRVFIGPGAKVFGKITIGHDVVIGANAVVNRSLPDRAVAVGVPAKIVSYAGSFDFVTYTGMEQDAARAESLTLAEQASDEMGDTQSGQ